MSDEKQQINEQEESFVDAVNAQTDYSGLESEKQENKIDPVENLDKVQKELEAFHSDPENKKRAIHLAKQIQDILGTKKDKWFSLKQVCKRVEESELQMFNSLKMLQLFGLCTAKVWNSSCRFRRGELVFRIHVSTEYELIILDENIAQTSAQLEFMKTKRNELAARLITEKIVIGSINEPIA